MFHANLAHDLYRRSSPHIEKKYMLLKPSLARNKRTDLVFVMALIQKNKCKSYISEHLSIYLNVIIITNY